MDVWDVIVASALPKSQDSSSSGELLRTCKSSSERATGVPSWTSHRRPTAFTALGAQGRRSRRQWGSACAMRLARSAPSCNQGTPGHSKIAQRRRGGWLRPGRRDPGRRRRLGGCLNPNCAVRAGFSTALSQGKARAQTQTTQGSDFNRFVYLHKERALHRLYM